MTGGRAMTGGSGLLLANAGFIVWSACFLALYALVGVGCELGWQARAVGPVNLLTATLTALWLLHLGPLLWLLRLARPRAPAGDGAEIAPELFLARVMALLTVSGVVSMLAIGVPILFLRPCA